MKKLDASFPQYRLTLAMTFILTLVGLIAVAAIPKEEDPILLNRNGFIKVVFPGADTEKLEDWVVRPLETKLSSIAAIKDVNVKIRPDVAVLQIELKASIKDTERAWNEVQRELDEQKPNFPSAVSDVELERNVMELESVLIAVSSADLNTLSDEAFRLKAFLERLPSVKSVNLHGDPDVGLEVRVDSAELGRRGITIPMLVEQIRSKNLSLPAGTQDSLVGVTQLKTKNSLDSVHDLRKVPLLFSNLRSGFLEDVATIGRAPRPVPTSVVRHQGRRAIVVGVVSETPIDVLSWGARMEAEINRYQPADPRTGIEIAAFQPARSLDRIQDLGTSLLIGMASVIVILGFWMGWRIGVVVAISVPVISLIGFGFYFIGGGVLHQISMAALLLSLGQFIDNVTVIAEATQRRIDEGTAPVDAARASSEQFRRPMIFATGTAVAAFLPLLASEGAPAEFTSSIPLIAVITLLVSYFFSLLTTPVLCGLLLRARQTAPTEERGLALVDALGSKPRFVLVLSLIVFLASAGSFLLIPKQFFPGADRNEFSVSLILPEATSILQTDARSLEVESYLRSHPSVTQVSTFVGQSTPHYYYSLIDEERVPNRADFLVRTTSPAANVDVARDLAAAFPKLPQGSYLIPKILNQGPPVEAAVELELSAADYDALVQKSHELVRDAALSETRHLRTTAPRPLATLEFQADERKALERGFDRNQLALNLLSASQGLEVSSYYSGGERYPIRLTQDAGAAISDLVAVTTRYQDFRISDFAKKINSTNPSLIERKNGERIVKIFSELAPGQGYESVGPRLTKYVQEKLADLDVTVTQGGQSGESASANLSILRALPFGMMLLIGCLLYEFRSYRKLFLVLFSVAVVSTGAFPGLLLGGQTFGFTALLGILALVGIVVNNCILIIEAIDDERGQGLSTEDAIRAALRLRARPILLTTIMTLAGLLPLALENSTLWPPMAWAMMSGLVLSTLFSLVTLPLLYRRLFQWLPLLLLAPASFAAPMDLRELLTAVESSDSVRASTLTANSAHARASSTRREAWAPKLSGSFERVMNDRDLFVASPVGSAPYGRNSYNLAGLELRQPLLALSTSRGVLRAREAEAAAADLQDVATREKTKLQVALTALGVLEYDEIVRLFEELKTNLQEQRRETQRLLPQGRTDPSDVVKVDVELVQTLRQIAELRHRQSVLQRDIQTIVPDFTVLRPIPHGQLRGYLDNQTVHAVAPFWETRALEKSLLATEHSAKALRYSYLPQLDLVARYQSTDQGFLVDETAWYALSLQLKWNIYDGGSQWRQQDSQAALARARTHQLEIFKRQTAHSVVNFTQEETKNLQDLAAYEKNTTDLELVLRKERQFYRDSKVTLNQVLDTERLLIQQRQNALQALYRSVRNRLERRYLEGTKIHGEEFD